MDFFEELTISLEESYQALSEEECRYDRVLPEITGIADTISMEAGVNRALVGELNRVASVHDIALNEKQFTTHFSPNGLTIALEGIAETTHQNLKKFIKIIGEWFSKVYKAVRDHAKKWFKSRDVEKREERAIEVLGEVDERIGEKVKEGESPLEQPLEITLLTKRILDMTNRHSKEDVRSAIKDCFVDFHLGDTKLDFTAPLGELEEAAKQDSDNLAKFTYEFYIKVHNLLTMAGFDGHQLPPIDPQVQILGKYNDWSDGTVAILREEAKKRTHSIASTEVAEHSTNLKMALECVKMSNLEKKYLKTISGLEDAIDMRVWEEFTDYGKAAPPEILSAFAFVEVELRRRQAMARALVKLTTLRDLFVFSSFDQITGAIKDLNVKTK